jgi:predicted transcriptional regulator
MPFKRRPEKRVVSRSFRVPPALDRALDEEARKRDWSKSFLIKEILTNWLTFHQAKRALPTSTLESGQ